MYMFLDAQTLSIDWCANALERLSNSLPVTAVQICHHDRSNPALLAVQSWFGALTSSA